MAESWNTPFLNVFSAADDAQVMRSILVSLTKELARMNVEIEKLKAKSTNGYR
jgi:hypothetical protein